MTVKYLELDSSYRNRNQNPNSASFACQISQTGINGQLTAVDPITNAYPIDTFKVTDDGTFTFTYIPTTTLTGLAVSSPLKFIISETTTTIPSPNPHAVDGYFAGAILYDTAATVPYRILEWISLGNNQYLITPEQPVNLTGSRTFTIYNGSSISSATWDQAPQYVFLPTTLGIPNYYTKYILYNQTQQNYTLMTSFDKDTHLAGLATDVTTLNWALSDVLIVRKEIPRNFGGYNLTATNVIPSAISGILNAVSLVPTSGDILTDDTFINSFVRMFTTATTEFQINRISGIVLLVTPPAGGGSQYYIVSNGTNRFLQSIGTIANTNMIVIAGQPFPVSAPASFLGEIMPFSIDNCSPFTYNGSLVSQNQSVSYDVGLNSLTIPNAILENGGRIAYYPYVYVEIENVSTTTGPNRNVIYSNNPNTYKAIFKIPITDLNHPTTTPFLKLNGNGMVQTITFKPNTDMYVSIKLPDGTIFKTLLVDNPAGQAPNPFIQTSFLFSMARV